MEAADRMKSEDNAVADRIQARNALEQTVYQCREIAHNKDSERLKNVAANANAWMEQVDAGDIPADTKDFKKKQQEVESAMNAREPEPDMGREGRQRRR